MPLPEFPKVPTPEAAANQIGAVGHLVSSALQTAGLYFQSDILNNFSSFTNQIAVVLFLAAAVGAVSAVALFGSYKRALVIITTPLIFLFLTQTRIAAKPIAYQVGERVEEDGTDQQMELLKLVGDETFYERTPDVSWFYAKFDTLVSSTVQALVSFLVDTENKKDLLVAARERVYSQLFISRSADHNFIKLVSYGLIGECAELTRLSQETGAAEKRIEVVSASQDPRASEIAAGLQQRITAAKTRMELLQRVQVPVDGELSDYLAHLDGKEPDIDSPSAITCSELWEYTRAASLLEASRAWARIEEEQKSTKELPWPQLRREVEDAVAAGNPEKVNEIVAAYILHNTVLQATHSNMLGQLTGNGPMDAGKYHALYDYYLRPEGEGALLSLQFFSGIIPYTQGLLLFLLSGAFPFFCLLILIPTRTQAVFIWMGCWVWVKSWDVGFALLYFIRDFLWQAMCGNVTRDPLNFDWSDQASLFRIVNEYDPLANQSMYYVIINILTVAVPVITAHLCLGASGMFDMFRGAIDGTARKFQSQRTDAVRRGLATMAETTGWTKEMSRGLQAAAAYFNDENAKMTRGDYAMSPGDGYRARAGEGMYHEARVKYHFSEEQARQRAFLAMVTGRANTQGASNGMSGALIQKWANEFASDFESPEAFASHWKGYLSPSDRAKNTQTSLPVSATGAAPGENAEQ